jgi:hypothetical protein
MGMKKGDAPWKVAVLGALLVVGAAVVYFNVFAGDSDPKSAPVRVPAVVPASVNTAAVNAAPAITAPGRETAGGRRRASGNGIVQEFKLRQGVEPGAEKPDPATIDPTLRLDLLAKLQQVELPGSLRNIFQYGAAPPPPEAVKTVAELPKNTTKIAINQAPPPKPPGPAAAPAAPTAPPITFKYYGYKVSKSDGRKEAFLLDGEDIIIAGENDSVKLGRYKVVRIGVNSITIEDTQFKSTQTLQLQPDAVA